MPEYRKIIETPPVTLHRKDIEELAGILTENLPVRKSASFSFSHSDVTFRFDSLEGLLEQKLPPVIDGLDFSVGGGVDENSGYERGISLRLSPTTGNYQIHSLDETWFKGKIQQINEFLKTRRPWYAPLRSLLFAGFLGAFLTIAFNALVFFIYQRSVAWATLAGLCLIMLSWVWRKFLNGTLFPRAKIMLQDPATKIDKNTVMVILTVLTLVANVLGIILQLLSRKN